MCGVQIQSTLITGYQQSAITIVAKSLKEMKKTPGLFLFSSGNTGSRKNNIHMISNMTSCFRLLDTLLDRFLGCKHLCEQVLGCYNL